jgi:hypothetical protein
MKFKQDEKGGGLLVALELMTPHSKAEKLKTINQELDEYLRINTVQEKKDLKAWNERSKEDLFTSSLVKIKLEKNTNRLYSRRSKSSNQKNFDLGLLSRSVSDLMFEESKTKSESEDDMIERRDQMVADMSGSNLV